MRNSSNQRQNSRKQQLLVLNGAIIAGITSAFMLLVMKPAETELQPVAKPDQSLKAKVDIARANVSYNVVEANMAVGRMNINGINKVDCDALAAANKAVTVNADFVRANSLALVADKKLSADEAQETAALMNDITTDIGAPRFVTEKRCLERN
jgi:hypothetical protein